jgi:hypothetical protein
MPLSEREQQILDQLEKDLHGDGASSGAPGPGSTRERFGGLKLGIVVFVAGIMLLVWFFVSGLIIVGVASFAAMVAGIVMAASSIRTEIARGGSPGERVARAVGGWEETLRRRYRDRDR